MVCCLAGAALGNPFTLTHIFKPPLSLHHHMQHHRPPSNNTVRCKTFAVKHGNPSSLSSQKPCTRVTTLTYRTLRHTCRNACFQTHACTKRTHSNTLLLDEVTPLFVSSPHASHACCWHHYLNTNTVFLSSSAGRCVLLISFFLLQPLGDGNVGLEGFGTWVSCGKPEYSLWPLSM